MTREDVEAIWDILLGDAEDELPANIHILFAKAIIERERLDIAWHLCPDCHSGNVPKLGRGAWIHEYPTSIPPTVTCRASGILMRPVIE